MMEIQIVMMDALQLVKYKIVLKVVNVEVIHYHILTDRVKQPVATVLQQVNKHVTIKISSI